MLLQQDRTFLSSGVANLLKGYECQDHIGPLRHTVQEQSVVSVFPLSNKREIHCKYVRQLLGITAHNVDSQISYTKQRTTKYKMS